MPLPNCIAAYRRFYTLHSSARRTLFGHYHLVDYHLNIVGFVAVGLHVYYDVFDNTVYTHLYVTFAADLLKQFAVMTLATLHHGSENNYTFATISFGNEGKYLVGCVFHHFFAAEVAVSLACTRIPQTHKVVNLCNCANCGTRIFVGGFLFNAYHGAETCDFVHIGTLQPTEKLTGVGIESFDVAPLSFGKNGVESKRRLAAAAETRYHGKFVTRNGNVNIFKVVYTCAVHVDIFKVERFVRRRFCCIFQLGR